MLRKFSIVTFVLSTTISVMGYLYPAAYYGTFHFKKLVPIDDGIGVSPDWFHIFFVGLAVASLVGIFVFKEDSKKD